MTPSEIRAAIAASPEFVALAQAGDTQGLADALSVGRKKLVPTEIGAGTVVAMLRGQTPSGGVFLDTIEAAGAVDRDLFWTMDLIKQGRLRIDLPETRSGLEAMAVAIPALAQGVATLLTLGFTPDPVSEFAVRCAIFADNGSLLV